MRSEKILKRHAKSCLNKTFEKCSFLLKFKEVENFNHRNTYGISRIKLKLHFVHNVETDAEIGQKGAFCRGLLITLDPFTRDSRRNKFTFFRNRPAPMVRLEASPYPADLIGAQCCRAGWIGAPRCGIIFERALNSDL